MSQINTYESVTYTGPITATRETTPIAGLIAGAVTECGRAAGRVLFPTLQDGDRVRFDSVNVTAGLVPPAELNAAWTALLDGEAGREQVLSRMAAMPLRYANSVEVRTALHSYIMADPMSEQQARAVLVGVARTAQEQVYFHEVGVHVNRALEVAGLRAEEEAPRDARMQFAGHSGDGRLLRVKVRHDAEGQVTLESETHGFEGRTCQAVVDRFHAALEMQGFRYSRRDRRWTGNACQMPQGKDPIRKQGPQRTSDTQQQ
jgi:hypothetical protein